MKRCAFLTLEDPSGFVIDDHLAYGPLADLGWRVEAIPWSRPGVAWAAYDAVVIRSTWDYTADPDKFLLVLAEIEQSGAPLFNGLEVVRWNLNKTYLRDLAARRAPIVPTVWREQLRPGELPSVLDELDTDQAVVKPVVGAGAVGAFRLDRRRLSPEEADAVEAYYARRALMVQPFVQSVVSEGEYSLFYFNGEYSHAILKTPQVGDFRVQEEHGGDIQSVVADDAQRDLADRAVRAVGGALLYARVDLVQGQGEDGYWLIELELIEPSLYLRMDSEAPRRFALALDSCVQVRSM